MVFQTTPWPDRGRKHPPRGGGGVSASRGEVMDPAYSLRKRLGRERSKATGSRSKITVIPDQTRQSCHYSFRF